MGGRVAVRGIWLEERRSLSHERGFRNSHCWTFPPWHTWGKGRRETMSSSAGMLNSRRGPRGDRLAPFRLHRRLRHERPVSDRRKSLA